MLFILASFSNNEISKKSKYEYSIKLNVRTLRNLRSFDVFECVKNMEIIRKLLKTCVKLLKIS